MKRNKKKAFDYAQGEQVQRVRDAGREEMARLRGEENKHDVKTYLQHNGR